MQLHLFFYETCTFIKLDIHLKIDAVTSVISEYDEYQRYIIKKSVNLYECLDINTTSVVLIFASKPQTKALQRTHPINGILKFISIISKNKLIIVQR